MFPGRMSPAPPEELQELGFSSIRRSLKSLEEIELLTVDEDLNDIERAVYLLSVGQEVQQLSVISNLPSLVRQTPAETFRRVIPKVREVLNGAAAETQLVAATSFLTILQDDIILIHTHTYSILKTVLLHLNHRDTVVSNAWLETLLLAINALPKETIKQEVLAPLLHQNQSQSRQTRLASCRILGKVACRLDSHIVKSELLPLARALCQDEDSEVRACMCRHLENMARAVGVEDTRAELLPELVALAGDGDGGVRLAAFHTIIELMELLDGDAQRRVVVPMVMAVCEDEAMMAALSFQFGKLCSGLAGSLSDEQKSHLVQKFKFLCVTGLQAEGNSTDGGPESVLIRCNCCYNLPAMLVFVDWTNFQSELYPSLSSLCSDPEVSVRQSAAASFHQVVKLLESDVHLVHKELLQLLQDEALEVLDALMNHLEETLEAVLSRGENLALENRLPELLAALLGAERRVGGSLRWRLHQKLLQTFGSLARLLPGGLLHHSFCPRILMLLTTNKVLPVQREAARTFCTFLRHSRQQEHRQEMMEHLIQGLALGRSYWNRLRFLDVCEVASEIFSRKFFNKNFLLPALELVHDPVANVRYKLCRLLPGFRASLRLPGDKLLLQRLDLCVQTLLCREKDTDVVAMIRKTVLELDRLELSEPFQKRKERESLDQKKEKEETLLLEMLQRQQSEANSDKHLDRKGRDNRTSLSATKSMSVSSSAGAPATAGSRKAKLSRSRSLSSQPSKAGNPDRPQNAKDGSSSSGKSSMIPSKDSSRTARFTMTTQARSSMPVLIRSNTAGFLDRTDRTDRTGPDHRTDRTTSDHRTASDHRTGSDLRTDRTGSDHRTDRTDRTGSEHRTDRTDRTGSDHRTDRTGPDHRTDRTDRTGPDHRTDRTTSDHRTASDHRTGSDLRTDRTGSDHRTDRTDRTGSDLRDHRTKAFEQRSKTVDHGGKDQSRKLSLTRKSSSFSLQSGRD
ncbi:serine/threonine-protein phosphatase 4 regulatory subunit 4 isoform 2-T2 [Menidia menidia]